MARTPLAARTRIDPSFSDGYESDNLGALGSQHMSLATVASGIYFRYYVRQSNIQLTCFSYWRSSVKTRLRCSLWNCDYTLQVLQQVATNDYKPHGRWITQIVKHECASVHIVKQQTATFQNSGSWVRTPVCYTLHTNMLHTY